MLLDKHPQKLHYRLNHAGGGVAVAAHDAVAQRTVVHAQAHGGVVLAADVDKRHECIVYALQLMVIFLVGIRQCLELAGRVNEVAGIDAHLVSDGGSGKCSLGVEMNVGNERHVAPRFAELGAYLANALSLAHTLRCEPDDFGTGSGKRLALSHACLDVVGVGVGH